MKKFRLALRLLILLFLLPVLAYAIGFVFTGVQIIDLAQVGAALGIEVVLGLALLCTYGDGF